MAQIFADKCIYEHGDINGTANTSPFQPQVGQNLGISIGLQWSGSNGTTGPVDDWHMEVQDYYYDSNTCQPGKMCGHYTQVNG